MATEPRRRKVWAHRWTTGRRGRHPAPAVLAILGVMAGWGAPAVAWEVNQAAPREDLEAFHRHFAAAVYPYARHGAEALNLIGFDLYVDLAYAPDFDDEPFAASVVKGDLPGGGLSVARVGARIGLPRRFNLGTSYGRVLDGGTGLLSADLQWTALRGAGLGPALALRVSYGRSLGGDGYDVEVLGGELLVSKKVGPVTPFAGVGVIESEGRFREVPTGGLKTSGSTGVVFAGVTVSVLVPRFTFSVERGEGWQAALRVGIGL